MVTAKNSENKLAKVLNSCRRGMRELDLLLTNFVETSFSSISSESQDLFKELLTTSDQTLSRWLLGTELAEPRFQDMVLVIRYLQPKAVL